jgi:hypothetical protein
MGNLKFYIQIFDHIFGHYRQVCRAPSALLKIPSTYAYNDILCYSPKTRIILSGGTRSSPAASLPPNFNSRIGLTKWVSWQKPAGFLQKIAKIVKRITPSNRHICANPAHHPPYLR